MRNREIFLSLIRLGLGLNADKIAFSFQVNWDEILALADAHGLSAIVLDGIERLPAEMQPPKSALLQWIGMVLQGEEAYTMQWKSACKMSQFFDKNHILTYILKGFVVSECYPVPAHRVSVDIDAFLVPQSGDFDACERGNQLMEQVGCKVDRSFYKNSTIYLHRATVENHRYMTPVRGCRRLKNLERMLQGLILDDKGDDRFEGTSMTKPPVMVTALFLIEHAYAHFLHEGLTWRHVLDWIMFSRKHHRDINWYILDALIDEYGFRKFYDSYTRLGKYLLGEIAEEELTKVDKKMLSDVWADLDLHDFQGVKGKLALAGNSVRATWKYHYFSDISMLHDLFLRVVGFIFERHPKI